MPLRITPNFEDFSCDFEVGRQAAKEGEEEDEILKAPCLRECVSAASGIGESAGRCPKLEG